MNKAGIMEEYRSILSFKSMATEMVLNGQITKRQAIKLVADFKGERMKKIRKEKDGSSGWHLVDECSRYKKVILPYKEEISTYMGSYSSCTDWHTTNIKTFLINGKTIIFHFQTKNS